jgi:hypothetical protein
MIPKDLEPLAERLRDVAAAVVSLRREVAVTRWTDEEIDRRLAEIDASLRRSGRRTPIAQ